VGKKNVIGVYPGTGLGGGIIIDEKIYRGSNGFASEFGHMIVQIEGRLCGCGQRGCLEAMSSKTALAKELVQIAAAGKAPVLYELAGSDIKKIKSGVIKKSIEAGEAAVIEAVDSAAYYLGIGIANLINIFNPELVILGGGLMEKLEDHMFMNVVDSAKQHAMNGAVEKVEFALSSLKDLSVALGAAALSFD
jgi:glucokinase